MSNNSKAESVVQYYVLCNKLKNVIRTGWKDWNVKRERVESVAEHIYGVQQLAIAMHSQFEYDIDIYKVILMLAIHELEEIGIGDLTEWQISKDEKEKLGHEAVRKLLEPMLKGQDIENIIYEFDKRETAEAKFAYHCDKLECNLQCRLYDEEGCVDITEQEDNKSYYDERVQKLLKPGEHSWSNMWLDFDRHRYADDENFMTVLKYARNNKISKD